MRRSTEQAVTVTPLPGEEVSLMIGDKEFVIPAACPHRKGRLAYAHVNAATLRVTCPLHRSTYELATGCQVSGPDAGDLPVRALTPGSEASC